jgi:hypothetical protein
MQNQTHEVSHQTAEFDINQQEPKLRDLPLWREATSNQLLHNVCRVEGVHPGVIADLVVWVRENQHRGRRAGLTHDFDEIFTNTEYWGD